MSWINEPKRTWAEWAAIKVLRVGPIPQHVAFIMDGNRRFARQLQKDSLEGHSEGFKKLTEVLSWCRDLGIPEVTVYAFSVENFKRSHREVDGLMALAEQKFAQLIKERELLNKHGVRIRVIGELTLLTPRLQRLIAEAVLATATNNKCCLNLALAYTGRQEVTVAVDAAVSGVRDGQLVPDDLTETLLEGCLYTSGTRDPDLLIRTSGEVRLSDFLLWQTGLTYLFFSKVLWPRISLWHFLAAIFHYQRHHHTLVQLRRDRQSKRSHRPRGRDVTEQSRSDQSFNDVIISKERSRVFLRSLRNKKKNQLVNLSKS